MEIYNAENVYLSKLKALKVLARQCDAGVFCLARSRLHLPFNGIRKKHGKLHRNLSR